MRKPGRPKGTTKDDSVKYLTEDQLKDFFKAVKAQRDPSRRARDELLFSLILFYGLRVGEAQRLRLADIDLETKQIKITALKHGLIRVEDIPKTF
jgi:integrase